VSRLWSRYGVRTLAVALLCVGVAGGYYLGDDRETQQQGIDAQLAAQTDEFELRLQRQEQAVIMAATAPRRAAEYEAGVEAAQAAQAAADRAHRAESAAADRARREREKEKEAKPYDGPIPTSCDQYSDSRQIGCALMLSAGFGLDQFPCLDKLWTRESHWNYKAKNPSGAYGIPQAKPGSKMSSAGSDWETSPATQIKWGLGYIEGKYATPCGAWQFSEAHGYY
jgi:hypothetical protein